MLGEVQWISTKIDRSHHSVFPCYERDSLAFVPDIRVKPYWSVPIAQYSVHFVCGLDQYNWSNSFLILDYAFSNWDWNNRNLPIDSQSVKFR